MSSMIRPDWSEVSNMIAGIFYCNCGQQLYHSEETRSHWQQGHFDYPENKIDIIKRKNEEIEELKKKLEDLEYQYNIAIKSLTKGE